jgi:hypothetical protein
MRHLVISWECGGLRSFPNSLLELGPGSSFGVGLAAMLTGANQYYALDAIKFTDLKTNLATLDELVRLFQDRASIPHGDEFTTEVRPPLKTYDFPTHILDDEHLKKCLSPDRVQLIRQALESAFSESKQKQNSKIQIFYLAPWSDYKVLPEGCADMILSNTVLECIDNLEEVFEAFLYWLIDGGFMSHNIDVGCHGCTKKWNGHWAISKLEWSMMRGKRPYLINREPYSTYVKLLAKLGFSIVCDIKFTNKSGILRHEIAEEFKTMSDDDLYTSGAILQAIK